jgi:hypothetical protein
MGVLLKQLELNMTSAALISSENPVRSPKEPAQ